MESKKLGIWMDHDHAHLIEFETQSLQTTTIPSNFKNESKEGHVTSGEEHALARHQRHQSEYFKALGRIIKNYQEVLLFGPTTAKVELLNTLTADKQFDKVNVQAQQGDKMTENQMHAFVKKHFSKN